MRSGHKTPNPCMRASHKVLMASKSTSAKECGHAQRVGFEVNGKEAHMWMAESWKQPQVPLTTINHKPHAIGDCMHLTRSSMHTHHGAHPHTCMTLESGDHCVDHHTIHSSQPHTSPSTLCWSTPSFNPSLLPSYCSTKHRHTSRRIMSTLNTCCHACHVLPFCLQSLSSTPMGLHTAYHWLTVCV